MEIAGIPTLATQVLSTGFILLITIGAIVKRTQFSALGAVHDISNMGDWARMRVWGMAMGVAMVCFLPWLWLS